MSANDTTATIAGGLIEYIQSTDISIESEVLKISLDQILIDYEFKNHSKKDIETSVAFPLPPSPVTLNDTSRVFSSWDKLFYAYEMIQSATRTSNHTTIDYWSPKAFLDFELFVNNQEHGFQCSIKAINANNQNITQLLIQNNIPLSASYINGFMDGGELYQNLELRRQLDRLNLLYQPKNTARKHAAAWWQLYITYYWTQVFPAGQITKVTHSYRPHPGSYWLVAKEPKSLDDIIFNHRDVYNGVIEEKNLTTFLSLILINKKL